MKNHTTKIPAEFPVHVTGESTNITIYMEPHNGTSDLPQRDCYAREEKVVESAIGCLKKGGCPKGMDPDMSQLTRKKVLAKHERSLSGAGAGKTHFSETMLRRQIEEAEEDYADEDDSEEATHEAVTAASQLFP